MLEFIVVLFLMTGNGIQTTQTAFVDAGSCLENATLQNINMGHDGVKGSAICIVRSASA